MCISELWAEPGSFTPFLAYAKLSSLSPGSSISTQT